MIRIIAFLSGILALGAALAWLADRPGDVLIDWQGSRIRMSVMALFLGQLAIAAVLIALWQLYRVVVGTPGSIADFFRNRRRIKGYDALSQGMIAVGAGNARFANQQAKQAQKLLRSEPLVGLLTAQAAQLSGDRDTAREAFENMLDTPETTLLGLHGLFVEAERQGQVSAARHCASEAVKRAPKLAWAAEADLQFKIHDGDWDSALSALARNEQNGLVPKADAKRQRAVLLTAKAMEIEDTEPENALKTALQAHKLAPEFVPAAMVAGRSAGGLDKLSHASSIIEKAWKTTPHPDLAAIYAHLRSGDTTQDRFKRIKLLAKKKPGHTESRIAMARAAIDASEWDAARKALEPMMARDPSRRVCIMMAQIEDSEHGDRGKVREWLARAVRAPRDPAWVADGHISDSWAPVSPVTQTLDGYEWAVPGDDGSAVSADILEALGAAEPEAPMIEFRQTPDRAADATISEQNDAEAPGIADDAKRQGSADVDDSNKLPTDAPTGSADEAKAEGTPETRKSDDAVTPRPTISKGMKRAMDSGAITAPTSSGAPGTDISADRIDNEKSSEPKPVDMSRPDRKATANGEPNTANGRRSNPETVAGVAVSAQFTSEEIESRFQPGQPDDPGPVSEGDENDLDKKKWMGLFN